LYGIVSGADKDPLNNVTISINSDRHMHTNINGEFNVSVSVGDTLIFTYLGYEDEVFVVNEKSFDVYQKISLKETSFLLDQVSVTNSLEDIIQVAKIDLELNPVRSSQEILNKVPGLFIAQHAGGGKAEQIFLRGFDIDHGTDIAINVDGMPVNMVSHAHGQGYADLHFVIPETIKNIDFGKGPYYPGQGNFTTAGYVNFKTKDDIERSSVSVGIGQFNTSRIVGMFDLLENSKNQNAYLATEYQLSDGPFDSPQNFRRLNIMGKYSSLINGRDKISIIASHFKSDWDASGQIPQRIVDDGTINRFGAVDDTEGGITSRTNLAFQYNKVIDQNTFVSSKAFFSKYQFELFSNFTFFLADSINGDQIRQFEDRSILGFQSTLNHTLDLDQSDIELKFGLGLRYDDINDNELAFTKNRLTTLQQLAFGNIDETNIQSFVEAKWIFDRWMINFGTRLDYFNFQYNDVLANTYQNNATSKAIVLPKLNILYNPNPQFQLYFKAGKSFHSNDSRVVIAQSGEDILPAAYGLDVGTIWKPTPRLWINPALWYLYLEQEFVYVGDEAIVEPSGETTRKGIDLSVRYQLNNNFFLDADFNYTIARSIDAEDGNDRIPLAPELTSVGGISYQAPYNLDLSLRYRYIRDRPANEDNSIVAFGYNIFDFNVNYEWKNLAFGFVVQNIFNQEWNEAQFATTSRLRNETEAVEELHFTPGVPRNVRFNITYSF
jgi:outer membrane receptor protein involved in Fe transport